MICFEYFRTFLTKKQKHANFFVGVMLLAIPGLGAGEGAPEIHGPVAERALEVPGLGLDMLWVGPGLFQMGSESGDHDERPVREVTISRGFWIGKHEVTQGQWEALMGTTVSQQRDKADPELDLAGVGENRPM